MIGTSRAKIVETRSYKVGEDETSEAPAVYLRITQNWYEEFRG